MGADIERNLSMFNSKDNVYGYEYRILIGSRVIQEGVNFNCIRYMYVLSLPRDISTLIQLYGRAIRAKSHLWLPSELRTATLYNLVTTFTDESKISPEVLNYKRKMEIYQQIQLIERELRRYAIDNFINYDKMDLPDKPTLDGLPYKPAFTFSKDKVYKESDVTTFRAYGYANIEVDEIIKYLKRLFVYRPVWTYKDLWEEVRHPSALYKTAYDQSTFDESNFNIALDFLVNGTYVELMEELNVNNNLYIPYINIDDDVRRVIHQEPYYILTTTDQYGIPVIDYDLFMNIDTTEVTTEVSITEYVEGNISEKHFTKFYKEYVDNYKDDPIMSLIKITHNFHYTICKYIIEGQSMKGMDKLIKLYKNIQLLLSGNDFLSEDTAQSYGITSREKPIAFAAVDFAYLYAQKKWHKLPINLFDIEIKEENKYVVGYTKQTSNCIDFKIRDSINSSVYKTFKDKRKGSEIL